MTKKRGGDGRKPTKSIPVPASLAFLVYFFLFFTIFPNKMKEALKILDKIEENVNICCTAAMDSEDVLVLIDKLRKILKNDKSKNGKTEKK